MQYRTTSRHPEESPEHILNVKNGIERMAGSVHWFFGIYHNLSINSVFCGKGSLPHRIRRIDSTIPSWQGNFNNSFGWHNGLQDYFFRMEHNVRRQCTPHQKSMLIQCHLIGGDCAIPLATGTGVSKRVCSLNLIKALPTVLWDVPGHPIATVWGNCKLLTYKWIPKYILWNENFQSVSGMSENYCWWR